MKIAIYGAGAIGALLGARLSEADGDVSLIARGDHLAAIQQNGLRIISDEFGDNTYRLTASDDPSQIGPVDYVILGVKAHALTAIAPTVSRLVTDGTTFVSTQNGLPWWYCSGGENSEERLESVDPGGVIARHMPPRQCIGSVVYMSCHVTEPGVIRHTHGVRLPLGEPDGSATKRVKDLAAAFQVGGIKAPIRNSLPRELWMKLLGNAIFNPLSALTRKTLVEMTEFPETRAMILTAMAEVAETAAAVGVRIGVSPEKRLEGARQAGFHKPSMLQDLEAGRSSELNALTGSVIELAHRHHVPAPCLEAVYAAAKLAFEPSRAPGHDSD
jgi:2-dehydropantoate 2-reductase